MLDRSSWTLGTRSLGLPAARSGTLRGESPLVYGIGFWLALVQVSIAASQIVLAVLVAAWLFQVFRKEAAFPSLPLDRPFLLYAGFTVAAAVFSFDPAVSFPATKELLLLVVPYLLVGSIRRGETLYGLVLVLVVMADLGALVGLWQYRFGELGDLDHRIRGFMSHYMTYSGLLMGVGILALASLLFLGARARHRWFLAASFVVIQVALGLTISRNAWIGTLAAVIFLLYLKDRKLLLILPLAALAAVLVLPRDVERRVFTFFSPDTSGWDRLYMLQAGSQMVRNHPLLGVGPEMVSEIYPVYVPPQARRRDNPHLHNNVAQIAAERGLPCLLAWLWFLFLSFRAGARELVQAPAPGGSRALAAGALGVILAGFIAGSFEYNFGDSEFQMMFLFVMSIPLVLERARTAAASAGSR